MAATLPDDNPIKTVSSKVVYQNKWLTIYEDETITPKGNPSTYAYLESKDSVMVAALDDERQVCLVRAFRYPSKSWGWELPGGGGENEDPTIATIRELEEETGIKAQNCEKIGESLVCNGFMTERMAVCVAYGLTFSEKTDHEEALGEIRFYSLDEISTLVDAGEINDGQTITGLYYLNHWLAKRRTIDL